MVPNGLLAGLCSGHCGGRSGCVLLVGCGLLKGEAALIAPRAASGAACAAGCPARASGQFWPVEWWAAAVQRMLPGWPAEPAEAAGGKRHACIVIVAEV
jgi:hypothetical protein